MNLTFCGIFIYIRITYAKLATLPFLCMFMLSLQKCCKKIVWCTPCARTWHPFLEILDQPLILNGNYTKECLQSQYCFKKYHHFSFKIFKVGNFNVTSFSVCNRIVDIYTSRKVRGCKYVQTISFILIPFNPTKTLL